MTETAQTVADVTGMATGSLKDVVDSLLPYLQQVADKLGTTAAYLWKLQVMQAKVVATTYIIEYLIYIAIFYATYKYYKFLAKPGEFTDGHGYKAYNDRLDRCTPRDVVPMVILLLISGLSFINVVSSIQSFLTVLINPEYWALQNVIHMFK